MWRIAANGFMNPLLATDLSEAYNLPRQSLPKIYWQTGYVDAVWTDTILKKKSMTGDNILPLIIGADEWIDIDSSDDWRRAERLVDSGEITMGELGYEVRKKNH
jgi:N-acylneuraminate cytidylyltransferase